MRRFVGRIAEQHAALAGWVVGQHPDRVPGETGEADDQLRREQRLDLEQRAGIDKTIHDAVHVVAGRIPLRQLAPCERTGGVERLNRRRHLAPVRR